MTNKYMTSEDQITLLNERLDLLVLALNDMRELIELHSQRLENIENKLFQLYPSKEPQ